jgi:DNA-binding MarR family transcriptional regulator
MSRSEPPDWALPFLLLGGFRAVIDRLHETLARQGHPDARPVHGFALQAIGRGAGSVTELAGRLGVTKQAAAKTVLALEQLDYVRRSSDPADARRQQLRLTPRGEDLLRRSGEVLADIRAEWIATLGVSRYRTMERALAAIVGDTEPFARLDAPGWLTGG